MKLILFVQVQLVAFVTTSLEQQYLLLVVVFVGASKHHSVVGYTDETFKQLERRIQFALEYLGTDVRTDG